MFVLLVNKDCHQLLAMEYMIEEVPCVYLRPILKTFPRIRWRALQKLDPNGFHLFLESLHIAVIVIINISLFQIYCLFHGLTKVNMVLSSKDQMMLFQESFKLSETS